MQLNKTFELGVYTFGNTPRNEDSSYGSTAKAIRNVLEAVKLAEEVGLDYFGFGEHHTQSMPVSSPTSLVNAAAASTSKIILGTTVSVLSTDEPIRINNSLPQHPLHHVVLIWLLVVVLPTLLFRYYCC